MNEIVNKYEEIVERCHECGATTTKKLVAEDITHEITVKLHPHLGMMLLEIDHGQTKLGLFGLNGFDYFQESEKTYDVECAFETMSGLQWFKVYRKVKGE